MNVARLPKVPLVAQLSMLSAVRELVAPDMVPMFEILYVFILSSPVAGFVNGVKEQSATPMRPETSSREAELRTGILGTRL